MITSKSCSNLMVVSKPIVKYEGFISIKGKPVVDAEFDLSKVPPSMVDLVLRVIQKGGMNLVGEV